MLLVLLLLCVRGQELAGLTAVVLYGPVTDNRALTDAVAIRLGGHGMHVVLAGPQPEAQGLAAARLCGDAGGQCVFRACADASQVHALLEDTQLRYGEIDMVYLDRVMGIAESEPWSDAAATRVVHDDVLSPTLVLRQCALHMRDGATLIVASSAATTRAPALSHNPLTSVLAAACAYLDAYVRLLGSQLVDQRAFRLYTVAAGVFAATPSAQAVQASLTRNPIFPGRPGQVAEYVAFIDTLVTNSTTYANGAAIVVDGACTADARWRSKTHTDGSVSLVPVDLVRDVHGQPCSDQLRATVNACRRDVLDHREL